jgi:two-component system sensor histidine kinase DegS
LTAHDRDRHVDRATNQHGDGAEHHSTGGAVALRHGGAAREGSGNEALSEILREARQAITRCDAELKRLGSAARTIRSAAERDQAQMQRFLEEFALEQAIYLPRSNAEQRPDGPLIDVDAIRNEQEMLASRIDRSGTLAENLVAAGRLLEASADFVDDERAYQAVQNSDSVQLQQGMSEAREDERRRLAREIHDGPAQTLANALFAVDMAEQVAVRHPEQVVDELGRARKQIKDGLAEIRRFMFELRPAALRDLGLVRSLSHYVQEYSQFFHIDAVFTADGKLPRLSEEQELTIFRIAQEALQNVRKHSGADGASVTLRSVGDRVELAVTDRGAGFEPEKAVARPSTGAGLPGMRERAKLINATFAITSAAGTGTRVELMVTV